MLNSGVGVTYKLCIGPRILSVFVDLLRSVFWFAYF